jgi:hypothetical protein
MYNDQGKRKREEENPRETKQKKQHRRGLVNYVGKKINCEHYRKNGGTL